MEIVTITTIQVFYFLNNDSTTINHNRNTSLWNRAIKLGIWTKSNFISRLYAPYRGELSDINE